VPWRSRSARQVNDRRATQYGGTSRTAGSEPGARLAPSCVARASCPCGGVERRPDEQALVPPGAPQDRGSCKNPRGMGVPPMKHGQDARATPLRLCASALKKPKGASTPSGGAPPSRCP
jgi:hypothetical protein